MKKKEEKFQVVCNNCSIKVGNSSFSAFVPYDPDFGDVAEIVVLPKGECGQGRQSQIASLEVKDGSSAYIYPSDKSDDCEKAFKLDPGFYVLMLNEESGEVTVER